VVGYDLNGLTEEQIQAGVEDAYGLPGFYDKLGKPRILFIYIPAGPLVDQVIDELSEYLDQGDIIVEGGNSYWGDSIRRQRRLKEQSIHFIDLGTSGGISGARHGACFMAGGEPEPVAHIEPVLRDLAVEGGYVHAGPPGAGHFVKLVHNGIEFGMLQAIGEGMDLLEAYRERLPLADILHCWGHGSVIRSWLIELMEQTCRDKGGLQAIPPYVEDTGEVNWLVDDALHMEVPVPVIAQSVMQLFASRDEQKHWARAIALMRHGFGGHPFGADQAIAQERKQGRVGGFFTDEADQ
jgi:6-phosphogluconate dehydrogenase